MARVTADEVRAIIDVSTEVTDLTPFITAAGLLVDKVDEKAILTDAQLKEVERWLAAHYVALRDPRRASEKAGSVGESYQYKLGLGLEVTTYGQQAIMLDTTGTLFQINKYGGTRSAVLQALT